MARLRQVEGVRLDPPAGAFYVLPERSAFFGPGAHARGFGDVPDSDAFCRYLIEVANVSIFLYVSSYRCSCFVKGILPPCST